MKKLFLFIAVSVLFSCKSNQTETTSINDDTVSQVITTEGKNSEGLVSSATVSNIVKSASFEDGDILAGGLFFKWQLQVPPTPGAAVVSSEWSRIGFKSLKLEVNTSQPLVGGSYRNMIYTPTGAEEFTKTYRKRIGFSTYSKDKADPKNELIFQYHIKTKTGATATPVISIWRTSGIYKLRHVFNNVDYAKINAAKEYKEYPLGADTAAKANDWVICADFAIDASGFIKVYRNGKLMVDLKGANFNKEFGAIQEPPYPSIGLYKFSWPHPAGMQAIPVRTMWYDRILYGSPAATYIDFANFK